MSNDSEPGSAAPRLDDPDQSQSQSLNQSQDLQDHHPEPPAEGGPAAEGPSLPSSRDDNVADQLYATRHRRRTRSDAARRRRKKKKASMKRNPGLVKKLAFLNHLLKDLDLFVFAELACLYYMDFTSLPKGPDYARGYQHGGIFTDFVGQKPATSRAYYLLVDLAILGVQCLMFSIHVERRKLRNALKGPESVQSGSEQQPATAAASAAPTVEELDVEERGLPPDGSGQALAQSESIEMRDLGSAAEGAAADGDSSSREAGAPIPPEDAGDDDDTRTHLSEIFESGNGVLGEYHLLHSLRTATSSAESTAAYSLQSISYSATLAAIEARRQGRRVTGARGSGRRLGP